MKRSFLSVVMFLSLSTVGYSQENKLNVGDWMEASLPKLSRYLNLMPNNMTMWQMPLNSFPTR